VRLRKPRYGYDVTARATVVANHPDSSDRILVRFDGTGHSVPVEVSALTSDDEMDDQLGAS
jgi:hypothetical protein